MTIICGIPNCPKCKTAKESMPDAKYVEFGADKLPVLINFCREIGVSQMPLIIKTDE